MSKVLVTGATGLLGCSLVPSLRQRGHQVTCVGHAHPSDLNVDLRNYDQTLTALDQVEPEIILNLTALTDVDRCEKHPQEAYLLNVKVVENVCDWVKGIGEACHLIHLSTDHVYNGYGKNDESQVNICNFYAMSKRSGEIIAEAIPSTILRTNFLGRSRCSYRRSLTDWLYDALCAEMPVPVFKDVMFSPLSISTLIDYLARCIEDRPQGTFNVGSEDAITKADFALNFARFINKSAGKLVPERVINNRKLLATRPLGMGLNSEKFAEIMNTSMPRVIDEIKLIANEYKSI